jgi:hypothetical protein
VVRGERSVRDVLRRLRRAPPAAPRENGQTIDLAIVPGTSMARVASAGFGANSSYTDFSLPRDGTWHAMEVYFDDVVIDG